MREWETMRKIALELMDLYDRVDQQEDTPKNAALQSRIATMVDIALAVCETLSKEEG